MGLAGKSVCWLEEEVHVSLNQNWGLGWVPEQGLRNREGGDRE